MVRPHGVWSDNLLVVAYPHKDLDLHELVKQLPEELRREDPDCEVISCKVVAGEKAEALETVVRTNRGPFSMTVIERRFRGGRLDYEVKYTVESKRFDQLVPKFQESFKSFRELPGEVPTSGYKEGDLSGVVQSLYGIFGKCRPAFVRGLSPASAFGGKSDG